MADEHGEDAPRDDLPKTLRNRALDAIDDAFIDGVKVRFGALVMNEYGAGLDATLGAFAKGLRDLREAREKALEVITKVFA
jgi:hypothetical protein